MTMRYHITSVKWLSLGILEIKDTEERVETFPAIPPPVLQSCSPRPESHRIVSGEERSPAVTLLPLMVTSSLIHQTILKMVVPTILANTFFSLLPPSPASKKKKKKKFPHAVKGRIRNRYKQHVKRRLV